MRHIAEVLVEPGPVAGHPLVTFDTGRGGGPRSVANFTRRDAEEFLALAAAIPVRTAIEVFALTDANRALAHLAIGDVSGAAVLVP